MFMKMDYFAWKETKKYCNETTHCNRFIFCHRFVDERTVVGIQHEGHSEERGQNQ